MIKVVVSCVVLISHALYFTSAVNYYIIVGHILQVDGSVFKCHGLESIFKIGHEVSSSTRISIQVPLILE